MTISNDNQDSLKLQPMQQDTFLQKSKLKRSELLDYEGSEFDECAIALSEGNIVSEDRALLSEAENFNAFKLKADETISMPGKENLKKQLSKPKYRRLWLAVPVAAAILLGLFILNQQSTDNKSIKNNNILSNNTEPIIIEPEDISKKNDIDNVTNKKTNELQKIPENITKKEEPKITTTVINKETKDAIVVNEHTSTNSKVEKSETPTTNEREFTAVVKTVSTQLVPLNNSTIEEQPDIQIAEKVTVNEKKLAKVDIIAVEVEIIEKDFQEKKSVFRKLGNLIAGNKEKNLTEEDWIDIELQNTIIDINNVMGKGSTIIKEFDEKGKLTNVQIASDGIKYNKQRNKIEITEIIE